MAPPAQGRLEDPPLTTDPALVPSPMKGDAARVKMTPDRTACGGVGKPDPFAGEVCRPERGPCRRRAGREAAGGGHVGVPV